MPSSPCPNKRIPKLSRTAQNGIRAKAVWRRPGQPPADDNIPKPTGIGGAIRTGRGVYQTKVKNTSNGSEEPRVQRELATKAADDESAKLLAEKAQQGRDLDPRRLEYDRKIAEQLQGQNIKITGIEHDVTGTSVFKTNQGDMRVLYYGDNAKGLIDDVKALDSKKLKPIIDVGSSTPDDVAKLQKKLKAQNIDAILHNPYSPEAIALATRHANGDLVPPGPDGKKIKGSMKFDEAASLERRLQELGPDAKLIAADEGGIAKHFGVSTKNNKFPEYLIEKNGKFYADEVKNTVDAGKQSIPHAIKKFENLRNHIERKYGKGTPTDFELHLRPGARIPGTENFSIGDSGRLLQDGKPLVGTDGRPLDVKIRSVDYAPTASVLRNADELRPKPGDPPGVQAPEPKSKIPDDLQKLNPNLQKGLAQADINRIAALGGNPAGQRSLTDLLNKADSPEMAKRWLDQLDPVDPQHRKALTQTLSQMASADANALLKRTIDGQPGSKLLGEVLSNVPEAQRGAAAKVFKALDADAAEMFLKMAKGVDSKTVGFAVEHLSKAHPEAMKLAGKVFGRVNKMMAQHGIELTGELAGRALRGTAKMLGKWTPGIGAAFAGYDTAVMANIAARQDLPPEIRYLGGLGVMVNGADAALGVAELFPPVNVAMPVNIGLGVSSLGLDLYTHHLIDQHQKGQFQSNRFLDTAIAGSAVAMGPAGLAMLYGNFGVAGGNQKLVNAGLFGSEQTLNLMHQSGLVSADMAGGQMRLTARGIDSLAEMVRHPERFGELAKRVGSNVQAFNRSALGAINAAAEMGGDLRKLAQRKLVETGQWLTEQGEKGFETMSWMAQNPGLMRDIAQRGFQDIMTRGGQLGHAAWNHVQAAGQGAMIATDRFIQNLQNAKQQGADMLRHIAENPGQAAQELRTRAIDGLANMIRSGQEGAEQAWTSLVDFADRHQQMGRDAINSLRDLALRMPEQFDAVARAWKDNLTEGGREVMRSLANLGDAGAEALGRLGRFGGDLALQAAGDLTQLAQRGFRTAQAQLRHVMPQLTDAELTQFYNNADAAAQAAILSVVDPKTLQNLGSLVGHENVLRTIRAMERAGLPVPHAVTDAARAWQNPAVRNVTGRLLDHQIQRIVPIPSNRVSPLHPDAEWWFGIRNPFGR